MLPSGYAGKAENSWCCRAWRGTAPVELRLRVDEGGLDAFAQGLGDALVGSGASVLIVRPGLVRTRERWLARGAHDDRSRVVGSAIVQALRKAGVIYVPGPLRFLMTAVKRYLGRCFDLPQ